jgi:hypothetical protein
MDNMLVHRPTFQAMEVLIKPVVSPGQERLLTSQTPMEGCGAADHLPSDSTRSEFEPPQQNLWASFGSGSFPSL